MIPIKAVTTLVGLSRNKVNLLMRNKEFPLPVKDRFGHIRWWKDEILAWKAKPVAVPV